MGSCIWYIWDVPREIPSVLKFQTRSVCVYGTAKDETSRFSYVLHTRSTYVKITRMCIITTFIISLYRILNPPQEQLLIYAKKHAALSTYPQPFSTFFQFDETDTCACAGATICIMLGGKGVYSAVYMMGGALCFDHLPRTQKNDLHRTIVVTYYGSRRSCRHAVMRN